MLLWVVVCIFQKAPDLTADMVWCGGGGNMGGGLYGDGGILEEKVVW